MRIVWFALFALVGVAVAVQAYSTGPPANNVVSDDGCTCHSANPNAGTVVNVAHPSSYLGAVRHPIRVTSTTDVVQNPAGNKGGFLAWASHGTFAKRDGSEDWYIVEALDGKSVIKHNLRGDSSNTAQDWRFDWVPPTTDVGTVTIKVWVNRVNGDGGASALDHWNRKHVTIAPSPHGDPKPSTTGTPTTTPKTPTSTGPTGAATTTATGTATESGKVVSDPAFTMPLLLVAVLAGAALIYRRR